MRVFYKLLHFILFTPALFLTINSTAQSLCEKGFSLTQIRELMESGIGGVRASRPQRLLNTADAELSKAVVKFRKAYNRGFFKEDERYIVIQGMRGHRGPAYIKSIENSLLVEEVDSDGNITERRLSSSCYACSINPSVKNFFETLDSRLAEVEPVTYPQFNKEEEAIKKGFKQGFQGLDGAYKMSYLADYLRRSKINPYTTHIMDFSDQIPEHIRFIREGIKEDDSEVAEKLETLDKLALEALEKQQEKGVTYAWWLKWNDRLMGLLKVKDDSFSNSEYRIDFFIKFFPDFIALPTFEELEFMAINKLTSENVFPLGLVNKVTFTENKGWWPYRFFHHDVIHAFDILKIHIDAGHFYSGNYSSITRKEFYEKIQDLPVAQQTQAEIVYFLFTHEKPNLYDVYTGIYFSLSFLRQQGLLGIFPEDVRQSGQVYSYLKEARRVYKKLLRENKFWLSGWPMF